MGRYYRIKEKWTPLALIGIRFYKSNRKELFIKVGNQKRRRVKK